MRVRMCMLFLTSLMLVTGPSSQGAEEKKDKDQFQGKWTLVSLESGGRTISGDQAKALNIVLTVKGDKYSFDARGMTETGTLKLDDSKKPKTLDVKIETGPDEGKTQLGIYALDKGKLKVCVAEAGMDKRPDDFKPSEENTFTLFVFEKAK